MTCFSNGKLAREVSLPTLEKIYVRLTAARAPGGNLNNRWLMQTHETVTSCRKVTLGSTRKFGLAFAVLFTILGQGGILNCQRFRKAEGSWLGFEGEAHGHRFF